MNNYILNKKHFFKRNLISIYVSSLIALGTLNVAEHVYIHNIKTSKVDIGNQINLSGRQRMLSQNIVKNVLILSNHAQNNPEQNNVALNELKESLDAFNKVQYGLINGNKSMGLYAADLPQLKERLHSAQLYFDKIVEASVILANLNNISDTVPLSEIKEKILENEHEYVAAMDRVVDGYVSADKQFDIYIDRIENYILYFTLFCIFGIGFGIFRPISKYIKSSFLEIEKERDELEQLITHRTKEVKMLSSAVEQSPMAILITTKEGLIQYVNPAFTKVTGYSLDDVLYKNPSVLASGHTDEKIYINLWNRLNDKHTWAGVLKNKHKSGRIMYMFSTIAPIVTNNEITNFIGIQQDITDRLNAEQDLIESEARMSAVMDTVPDAIITINMDGTINSFNKAAEQIFGYTADEMIGQLIEIIVPDEYKEAHRAGVSRFGTSGKSHKFGTRVELEAITKQGKRIWIEMALSSVPAGNKRYITGLLRDISERKAVEEAIRIAAVAFETQEGILVTDSNGKILKVNNAFSEMTGYTSQEVVGKNPSILKSGKHDNLFYENMYHELSVNKSWSGEIWNRRKNGEIFPEWQNITAVMDKSGKVTHYVSVFTDITTRKADEERIRTLAYYDPLTRLPNRSMLLDRVSHAISTSKRTGQFNALMFLDLDHFKNLNDTQGHDKGDLLLQEVAMRLLQSVRLTDTVARLSGDEFVIMLESLGSDRDKAIDYTEQIANKINKNINNPYILCSDTGETEFQCSASIGISLFSSDTTLEEVLKQADVAMYQSKAAGRDTTKFFDPKMQTHVQERIKLESELRSAIAKKQLFLTYQVQVDAKSRPIGAEALVRWVHPELGFISPASFIPLAEDTGLIYDLGLMVLEKVSMQIKAWDAHPVLNKLTIAVNVSAKQFRNENFINDFVAVVNNSGISFNRLKIELTESALMHNIDEIIAKMCELRELGCEISLDDFGTGYSSLSYLKLLPLSQLKIDQSFTRDILIDHNDEAIASIIISLGHTLDLNVIAEGVETKDQYKMLSNYDCQYYQGYYFGKPMEAPAFEALIDELEAKYLEEHG